MTNEQIAAVLYGKIQSTPEVNPFEIGDNPFDEVGPESFDFTPELPDRVYELLPPALGTCCSFLKQGSDRDLFLLGLLTLLSGAFPINIKYRDRQSCNVYLNVVAPASSGKSAIRKALEVLIPFDKWLIEEAKKQEEARSSENAKRIRRLRFILSADASLASLTVLLGDNEGRGAIVSTEAVSLINALKKEWGNYIEILLKGFQGELIIQDRLTRESVRIEQPAFAVLLSGTPNSFKSMFKSLEDGLFSRFMFYWFRAPVIFVNQFSNELDDELESELDKYASFLLEQLQRMHANKSQLSYQLSERHRNYINHSFETCLGILLEQRGGLELRGNNFRAALIAVKLSAVLRLLRAMENGHDINTLSNLEGTDEDVEAAVRISLTCLQHAVYLSKMIPHTQNLSPKVLSFWESLPAGDFSFEDAINGGPSRATCYRYRRQLVDEGLLIEVMRGVYRKVEDRPLSLEGVEIDSLADVDETGQR